MPTSNPPRFRLVADLQQTLNMARSWVKAALVGVSLLAMLPALTAGQLPRTTLSVRRGSGYSVWWRSTDAPRVWQRAPLAEAAEWRRLRPGLELAELDLAGDNASQRWRLVVARLDPQQLDLSLRRLTAPNGLTGIWTVDDASPQALLAVNAGQFEETGPWGWLVLDGKELRFPATGPLSAAVVVDTAGQVHFLAGDQVEQWRLRRNVRFAFQSYPVLLEGNGRVPGALFERGGVDLRHRDIRLALGQLSDGKLLVMLTRYSSLGRTLARAPFGPTTPEMAAIAGALGARRAVALDGGISAQMFVRPIEGAPLVWRGFRKVPLALEASARTH